MLLATHGAIIEALKLVVQFDLYITIDLQSLALFSVPRLYLYGVILRTDVEVGLLKMSNQVLKGKRVSQV